MGDTEYLEKKVEALETLYQAEKERASEIQRNFDSLNKRIQDLEAGLDRIINQLRSITRW
jgi:phage shock protein A